MIALLAQIVDAATSPTGLLATNGLLAAAVAIVYRDQRKSYQKCEDDRTKLWERVVALENRTGTGTD